MVRWERSEADNGLDLGRGVINGLLVSIPLWLFSGIVLALLFHHGPMEEATSATLMISMICGAILVRPYARTLWVQVRRYASSHRAVVRNDGEKRPVQHAIGDRDGPHSDLEMISGRSFQSIEDILRYVEGKSALSCQTRRVVARATLFRQSVALSALLGAYLQYYFLEINLQIASLHSLTVFLPVTSTT
jgi:hypothetical protein